jgi:hypothetical protein
MFLVQHVTQGLVEHISFFFTRKATNFEPNMGDNSIEQTNETKHLGPMRNSDNKIKVDERIRVGRKTPRRL